MINLPPIGMFILPPSDELNVYEDETEEIHKPEVIPA
jgi:hypothetical protein